MKILIVAVAFSSEPNGVQRHALNLVRCLLHHPAMPHIYLVVAPWQQQIANETEFASHPRFELRVAEMKPGSLNRNLWYYRHLPALARGLEADLVHLTYPAPVNARSFPCPTVVTLHDLYPYDIPSNFGLPKVIVNQLILQQCLRNVAAIACVSDSTCRSLERYVSPRTHQRALRIHNCVEPVASDTGSQPLKQLAAEPFLLCVAQHRANKNILFLLHTFARMLRDDRIPSTMKLAIVGISGPETSSIRSFIQTYKLAANIQLLHGLSGAEMNWCYLNCATVVAPSRIEGFGLPVVEALLAGSNVVCSDIAAFREVGNCHCRYVRLDGEAEENFAQAIEIAILQPRRPPAFMPSLSGPLIAHQYLQLYRRLVRTAANPSVLMASRDFAADSERKL